jgi:uncharacterized RDD family membrane protein YckC
MACPLCGDECHCSPLPEEESSHVSVLIDPEDFDASEQRFSASLERPAEAAGSNAPLREAPAARPDPPPPAATARDFYRPDDTWRREVSSKVDAYRRRRRRYDPNASLPLNFDATQPDVAPQSPPLPSFVRAQAAAQALAEAPKIIEFPRPAPAEELAEPLVETPRILEAAEAAEEPPQVEPSPPMPAITLPPEPQEATGAELEEPELALLVAPVSQRVQAAVVDGVVVLAACAIFAMIFLRLAGETPHGRMALALASLIPSFFWAVYQYLFLVYAGTTPGMQATQLSLETFEGEMPTRQVRRFRALAMAVSCMSLGLGYLWALVDEDRLCWHDRITRTYVV